MKSLFILLAFNLLILAPVAAQTPSVTKPVTKGLSTTTTKSESVAKPASVSSTTTSRSAVRPAATATPAPNRQQELYDQYHGVTKKPSTAAPAPTMPADQPTSRPSTAVANTSPAVGRPVSSEGSLSGFRLGVRGGVTYLVYLEEVTGIKPAIGFVGGLFANVGKGTFSFQPELNYARYMFNVQNPSGPSDITGAVDQFEIPLLLKISSGSVQTSRFFLNIGPYGAYVSSASINGQKISLSDATNRFRFGAAAGVGAALKTGPGHLTVELRGMYELGDSDTGFTTDSRTVYPQLTIGYLMPLGGR
ncbi:porin family protein [Spirosoma rigui]|uniref:porin family protein n=1 Tax=Spirosoma rigui TaxID=564064 RepID=UPI0014754E26|nr:porin family protein [Spirosoma rigui]